MSTGDVLITGIDGIQTDLKGVQEINHNDVNYTKFYLVSGETRMIRHEYIKEIKFMTNRGAESNGTT